MLLPCRLLLGYVPKQGAAEKRLSLARPLAIEGEPSVGDALVERRL
jgi:hypothetical protein